MSVKAPHCKICDTAKEDDFSSDRRSICKDCYKASRRKLSTGIKDTINIDVVAVEALIVALDDNTVMLTIADDYGALWTMRASKEAVFSAIERLNNIEALTETTIDSATYAVIKKYSRPVIETVRLIITLRSNTVITCAAVNRSIIE